MEGDKWQLGGPGIIWISEASCLRACPGAALSVTIPFHSADTSKSLGLPFPRFILRAEQACQDHRWQVSLQAPYCPCRLHRTHCRVAATVGPLPSAPSLLAVHLSPRPPPSFPSAFRCTPTRHAWMPRAGSSLCRAPTTAIRSRVAAAPAPGAPTWKPPATAGSRAQLRAEFPRNP